MTRKPSEERAYTPFLPESWLHLCIWFSSKKRSTKQEIQLLFFPPSTLESGINIRVRLLIFEVFPGAIFLLKGATFIDFWFLKNFLWIFSFLFLWFCVKESHYLLFDRMEVGLFDYIYCFCQMFQGLCLFKGVRLFRTLEYTKVPFLIVNRQFYVIFNNFYQKLKADWENLKDLMVYARHLAPSAIDEPYTPNGHWDRIDLFLFWSRTWELRVAKVFKCVRERRPSH